MTKLTKSNQGYYDRLQRAQSWIDRATACAALDWDDDHGQFIFYWIALSSLSGQVNPAALDGGRKKGLGYSDDDPAWFLERVCRLDQDGVISTAIEPLKTKVDNLIRDKYLLEPYWRRASRRRVERRWKKDDEAAQEHYRSGGLDRYLGIAFRRLRVLRNQVFHGCATDRISLAKPSVARAVTLLETLVPAFLLVLRKHGKEADWPAIPYPRYGSPQNPESRIDRWASQ